MMMMKRVLEVVDTLYIKLIYEKKCYLSNGNMSESLREREKLWKRDGERFYSCLEFSQSFTSVCVWVCVFFFFFFGGGGGVPRAVIKGRNP